MPRLSNRGTFAEILVLNAVLATAAWGGRLPAGFYFTSGFTNLLMLTHMKSFRWWFGSLETLTLKSGRAVLISLGIIWVLAGLISMAVFKVPVL
jgi:hypothetical protein